MQLKRHALRLLTAPCLGLALVAAGMTAVPPASAAPSQPTHWTLSSHGKAIWRDGVQYKVRLVVHDDYDPDAEDEAPHHVFAWVVLTSRSDPAGPVRARQSHRYDRLKVRFRHPDGSQEARVVTPWGDSGGLLMDLRYSATRTATSSCAGGQRTRGQLTGHFRFDTGAGTIGVVRELSHRATLTRTGDGCGGQSPAPTCQQKDRELYASADVAGRSDYWFARLGDGAATATVSLESFYDGGIHRITAVLPSSAMQIPEDLSSVRIEGAPGSYFTGEAYTVAAGDEEVRANDVPLCGEDPQTLQVDTVRRLQPLRGDLAAHFATGPRNTSIEATDFAIAEKHATAANGG